MAWQDFADALAALSDRRAADEAPIRLATWEEQLCTPSEGSRPAPEKLAAAHAIREQDTERYSKELDAWREAHRREHRRRRCAVLLDSVRRAHPLLADQLTDDANDPTWEKRLDSLAEAWAWATASAFIKRRRTPGRERQLEGELGSVFK
ncbi:hypothetical protein [Streptomyces sp. NPDC059171]|uniref:hypothetical protein n=1 Tax=Streptomyces sp. NPDC059171 TaxID=3346755 RepID=UPI0036A50ED8